MFKAPWRVIGLEIIGDRELYVWFVDGTAGRVKFMPSFFEKEAFAHLADPAFFEEVDVRYGTVIWPGNIDLAPDAMHDAIVENGEWVLQ